MEGITMKRFVILLFSCCAFVSVAVALADYDHSATVGPEKGWLLIHGGGRLTENAKSRFVALAGGTDANFVLIPTALADEEIDLDKAWNSFSRWSGAKHVTVLHTRNRKRANSDDFVEPLKHASGVWIDGGRQWRLADAYLGTAVEREIKALLARGGVVGGSSAGATIQGSYLVRGASGTARNPNGDNTIMMSPGHEKGFGLLPNSAIDQHVITRHREGDLDPVIASHPELLGIGIDESAAIVVHGDAFEVMEGQVVIHDGRKHAEGNYYYLLSQGQKFNLRTRTSVPLEAAAKTKSSAKFGWKQISMESFSLNATDSRYFKLPEGRLRLELKAEEAISAGVATAAQYVRFKPHKILPLVAFKAFQCAESSINEKSIACTVQAGNEVLAIRDQRGAITKYGGPVVGTVEVAGTIPEGGAGAGIGTSMIDRATRPNKVVLIIYQWTCIEGCGAANN
jgi:cyanophycinase